MTTLVPQGAMSTNVKHNSSEGDGDEGWRVLLLRGLVTGDLELTARTLHDHIEVLSLPFTKTMPEWKLQWESLHWWILRDATPLFVASIYSHPVLVQWLLLRGADRASKCYLGRTPLEFVGECCETVMTKSPEKSMKAVLERSDLCRKQLTAPPALPAPPMDGVCLACHISTQVVVVKSPPLSSSSSTRGEARSPSKSMQQTIYKCLVEVTWETPLSNGALIEKYEVRYRLVAEDGEEGSGENRGSNSWRVDRATHNRKMRDQRIMIENLQFNSTYDVMLRSWNSAGKGEWSRAYKFRTLTSPEQTTT